MPLGVLTWGRADVGLVHGAPAALPPVDRRGHGVSGEPPDRAGFEAPCTEGGAARPGPSPFGTPAGPAVRRCCVPPLGPERPAPPERAGVYETVRLERVGEGRVVRGAEPDAYAGATCAAVEEAARRPGVAGVTSVAAYRTGLVGPGAPLPRRRGAGSPGTPGRGRTAPSPGAGAASAARTALGPVLPLQPHSGVGDRDLRPHRADPAPLTDRPRPAPPQVPVAPPRRPPFHRRAGHLTAVQPQAPPDPGLASRHRGPARAAAALAKALETAPYPKLLSSSDAYGPAEFRAFGAPRSRRAPDDLLPVPADADEMTARDARAARRVGGSTYRAPDPPSHRPLLKV